jgi:micrococcal nuclease
MNCPDSIPLAAARRRTLLLLVTLLVFAAACQGEPPGTGQVLKVFDGDSFIMREAGGREIEVRLHGIDAPERRQPWSNRSRRALVGMLRGRPIVIEPVTIDAYGRTVAVVYRQSDNINVNEEMVRQGHAWVYRRYTDDERLIRLEEAARSAGIGLWGLSEAERVPPWEWRRKRRVRDGSGG